MFLLTRRHRSPGSGFPLGSSWCTNSVLCVTATLLPQLLIPGLSPRCLRVLGFGLWGIHNCHVTWRMWAARKVQNTGVLGAPIYSNSSHWFPLSNLLLLLSFFFSIPSSLFFFLPTKDNKNRDNVFKKILVTGGSVFSLLLKSSQSALCVGTLQFSTYLPVISLFLNSYPPTYNKGHPET